MILLEKIFFYLLVFCLPFQTRKIIYQFGGGFNEWTSVYLYLTDILLILIFLFWIWRIRENRFLKDFKIFQFKNHSFWLSVFLIISFISLIQARNLSLGFYSWLKLLEFIGLFFYLKCNYREIFNFKRLAQVFVASGLIQSIIAISQFTIQKDLGLKFLTESPLGANIDGVAKFTVDGLTFIRTYGSLPHPNILAFFLLTSIFFLYFLWLEKEHTLSSNLLLIVIYSLLITALFLTFSRIIIVLFVLSSLFYFIFEFYKSRKEKDKELSKKILLLFLLFIIFCSLFIAFAFPELFSRFSISSREQSVTLRAIYNETAYSVIQEYPLIGIGLGNFVWEIREMLPLLSDWIYQPVHNVYFLITSEIGLLGLIIFLMFLYQLLRKFKKQNSVLFIIIICILFVSLFDHFFWTLQQGQLMLWLILGLIASLTVKDMGV